jgi:uncharacterized protein (DUF983 family)
MTSWEPILPDDIPARWEPDRSPRKPLVPMPGWPQALRRGLVGKCPSCGVGDLFHNYLKVPILCAHCGAPLGAVPSDDAPPYITLLLSLHVVGLVFVFINTGEGVVSFRILFLLIPLLIILMMALLRPVKGATIATMLKLDIVRRPDVD